MERRKLRDRVKDNPVRTAEGVTGLLASLLMGLFWWALDLVPGGVPSDVKLPAAVLVLALVTYVSQRVGNWLQKNFTEPKEVLDNIIRQMNNEKVQGTPYAKARATDDTDPHGDPLEDTRNGDH